MSDVRVERRESVGIVSIDRPEKRNALSPEVLADLADGVEGLDRDRDIHCIVIAGSDKVFAAGADIGAMVERTFQEVLEASTMPLWQRISSCSTPLIAAVSGFALGGGCELALLCDMIVASETAQFGQPEVTLGIIPGAGGTQRLARVIGKQRAMEMVLTGRRINAQEAHSMGIVNVVASKGDWLEEAVKLAEMIASRPPLAVRLGKQAVLAAEEMPLTAALAHERRLYELAMATEDRVEGMIAFIEKREPRFEGR